ncbi:hypothetical protein [Legionella parisiensis]|uniref:hypothetical protein n=1 Tax=Legionella parisiensis TaxID=45071 RepID=UPI000AE83204|nr:hypothetical protein [Legionella parisiensis]
MTYIRQAKQQVDVGHSCEGRNPSLMQLTANVKMDPRLHGDGSHSTCFSLRTATGT